MGVLFIILCGLFIISFSGLLTANEHVEKLMYELLKASVVSCIVFVIIIIILANKPQAIDVYRGKTTLQITYKDSIAVDSVVVFKEIEEQQ